MIDTLNIMLVMPEIFLALTAMGFLMVGVFSRQQGPLMFYVGPQLLVLLLPLF